MIFTEKKKAIAYIKALERMPLYVRIKCGEYIKELKGARLFCLNEVQAHFDYEQIEVMPLKERENV